MKRQGPKIHRRGVTLIWTAVWFVVLIGFAGLGCDVGYVFLVAHQLQNAADAAALAAARVVHEGEVEARLVAVQLGAANVAATDPVQLSLNEVNDPEGDIVVGRYDRETQVFTPTLNAPTAIKVVARRTTDSLNGSLPLFFGPAFGVESINFSRTAIAMNEGGTGAGLITLCSTCDCAFEISGNSSIVINGGEVQVNSSAPCAVCGRGNALIDAGAINVAGGTCFTPGMEFPGTVNTGAEPLEDPLAFLPEPTFDTTSDLGTIQTSGTYPPGYYSGGVQVTGGDITLLPGIFILDGAGLHIGGNANFTAVGVMSYIPPGTGSVDIGGTGVVVLSPPDPELYPAPGADVYEHVSIFQSRSNSNPATIIGTAAMDIQGTLYLPVACLDVGGTGYELGSQVVVSCMKVFGNGVTINYDGSFSAPGNTVFLVQ